MKEIFTSNEQKSQYANMYNLIQPCKLYFDKNIYIRVIRNYFTSRISFNRTKRSLARLVLSSKELKAFV